jgi:hypothetical protein
MNIIIINVCINWVYRLYEEYILSIKEFINKHYNNEININILYYDISSFNINLLNDLNLVKYDKIFYTGDLNVLNIVVQMINNNYKKIYFINIEQLSHPSYYIYIRNVNKNINIIDYSEENIPFCKSIYNNVFLFPPYFNNKINNSFNKTIDIMSIVNNDYRKNIIHNLNLNKKYKTLFIDNCYGTERDELFLKTKIYINIHCSDKHNTMELIRIINLLMNKVIIITSNSIYSDLLYIKDHIIICNKTTDFSILIDEVLKNYDYYYNKIIKNFNNEKYFSYIKKNLDMIIYDR